MNECLPACAEADVINLGGLNHDGNLLRVGYAGTFELALWQRVQLRKLKTKSWEHVHVVVFCWRWVEATSCVYISELSAVHHRGGVSHA